MAVLVRIAPGTSQGALTRDFNRERRPIAFEDLAPCSQNFGGLQFNSFPSRRLRGAVNVITRRFTCQKSEILAKLNGAKRDHYCRLEPRKTKSVTQEEAVSSEEKDRQRDERRKRNCPDGRHQRPPLCRASNAQTERADRSKSRSRIAEKRHRLHGRG